MTTDEVKMIVKTTPERTIAALCQRSDQISREKGWVNDTDSRPYHTSFILQVSELSEALEEYRNNKPLSEIYYRDAGGSQFKTLEMANKCSLHANKGFKPEGIPIELADYVIRVCQRCGTDKLGERLQLCFDEATSEKWGEDSPQLRDFELMLARATCCACNAWTAEKGKDVEERLAELARSLDLLFAFCAVNGIDLWAAIDEKEAYNRTRPQRHGGKKI